MYFNQYNDENAGKTLNHIHNSSSKLDEQVSFNDLTNVIIIY